MPATTNLLTAQQAFNSFTTNGALYSDYIHRIAPFEVEQWFALAGNNADSALMRLKHSKDLLVDVEVAGATIMLKESGNDALLIDPGPYTSSVRLVEVNPCAILLTHAHKDHIAGLSWAFSSWGDVRVIMSDITHELLLDILHRSNQYTLAELSPIALWLNSLTCKSQTGVSNEGKKLTTLILLLKSDNFTTFKSGEISLKSNARLPTLICLPVKVRGAPLKVTILAILFSP